MAKTTKAMIEQEKARLQDKINHAETINNDLRMQLAKLRDGLKMIEAMVRQLVGS